MKAHHMTIFLILSLVAQFAKGTESKSQDLINEGRNRRILHQPLLPASSAPPPPPPRPLSSPNSSEDQPFFHELPNGPAEDQTQHSLPVPATGESSVAAPGNTRPSTSVMKLAIAVASAILTVGMLSTLAFYLYKHRTKHSDESQKLVSQIGNSQTINGESRLPPSNFLYIGTVEPSARSLVDERNADNSSPYRKLNPGKRSNRYRPSPDLQPLPPLTKPPQPPAMNSPPPMSSSDDESHDTNFCTPQGSSMSNESPGSRHSFLSNNIKHASQTRQDNNRVPHSKRTSPTRKPVIIPSIKQSLRPAQPNYMMSSTPKQTKFAAPPPPPPPPPPPQVMTRKSEPVATETPLSRRSPSPKAKPRTMEMDSSSEKVVGEENDGWRPKLKPLHWDKVRTTSDRATVWDQLKSSSFHFQLNENAMESLFQCNSVNSWVPKQTKRSYLDNENRVLDPKKSQNIAILIRALNVTREEVSEALLHGNPEVLGPELLETLVKMAPTKEEEIKLKAYDGESSRLGSAERFLKTILDIPFAFKRVEAMLYRANFDTEVKYLRRSFHTLEEASQELKNSRMFLKLLEAVLRTGNRMNVGTNRGDARAFKLETLLKLVDVKGTDGKTTLLHFVVQEIIRSEGLGSDPTTENPHNQNNCKFKEDEFKKQGLQIVSGLSKELDNVKKAAGMDSDVLNSYVSKLEVGLENIGSFLQQEKQIKLDNFIVSMKSFLTEASEEISRIKAKERTTLSLVKEVTEYFHGDAAKEEAHPFRIFVIVRDFLSILDKVCKDVGRIQDRATVGTGKSFRMPVTTSLPVFNRYNMWNDRISDDDSL